MCNKAKIFKNQLGYFRIPSDINKLWAHREVLVKSVMLIVDPWELAPTVCPIYMYHKLNFLYHLLNQRLFLCTCLCWNQVNKWSLLLFICRFYGTMRSCGAGIYIAQNCLPPPPFSMHKNIWPPPLLFPPDFPLPCN
jgi:hypothetical protein